MENERRTLIAIFISIAIVMIYSEIVLAPYTRQMVPPPTTQNTTASQQPSSTNQANVNTQSSVTSEANTQNNAVPNQTASTTIKVNHPSPAEIEAQGVISVETEKIRAKISLLGGRILSLRLKGYKRELKSRDNYEMALTTDGSVLPLAVHSGGLNDDYVVYSFSGATEGIQKKDGSYQLKAGEELSLKLSGTMPNGSSIEKILKFSAANYLFDVNVALSQPSADGSRVWLEWSHFDPHAMKKDQFNFVGYVYLNDETVNRVAAAQVGQELTQLGFSKWISFADKYFMATLIPSESGQNTAIKKDGDVYLTRVGGTPMGGSFRLYVGPKDYTLLKSLGLELQRNIDLGWFTFLAYPLLVLLRFLHQLFGNWGLSIVILTIVIKGAFLPLTKSSFKSMAAMSKIQPEMQAIRQKHKADPNKMNQEMLALYKRHGVNPVGGCFPILIQIPVFLGLYNSLLYAIELRHAPFALWIQDLSTPEHLELYGIHVPVLVLLMGVMMLWQQWLTPSPDPLQKKIMMVFTVFLTFVFVNFPAGLALYWLVNNIISVTQQSFIRKERSLTPGRATLAVSIGLFVVAYVLTLFGAWD